MHRLALIDIAIYHLKGGEVKQTVSIAKRSQSKQTFFAPDTNCPVGGTCCKIATIGMPSSTPHPVGVTFQVGFKFQLVIVHLRGIAVPNGSCTGGKVDKMRILVGQQTRDSAALKNKTMVKRVISWPGGRVEVIANKGKVKFER